MLLRMEASRRSSASKYLMNESSGGLAVALCGQRDEGATRLGQCFPAPSRDVGDRRRARLLHLEERRRSTSAGSDKTDATVDALAFSMSGSFTPLRMSWR